VHFVRIISPGEVEMITWERGAGYTLACGTGACAAVVIGRQQGLLDPRVEVSLPGGELVIEWQGEDTPVMMSGPAESVFEGSIEL
jgi:diaminopimelate epimerase